MKCNIRLLGFVLYFIYAVMPVWAKEAIRSVDATVVKIADGDTLTALDSNGTKLKIRLYGIDAPETEKSNKKTGKISKVGQPSADEAHAALTQYVLGKQARIDIMDIDRYKRLVSVVFVNGTNINEAMVKNGWAWAYQQYLSTPYKSAFIDAENSARKKRLGLWKDHNPEPPWKFRKMH